MKCNVCGREGTTYNYYGFNLCPRCNGYFRDVDIPDHIPEEQWNKYKLLLVEGKFSGN